MDGEEWRLIPDFQGYEVSSHGRVRSFFRNMGDGWAIDPHPQRILSPCTSQPYPFVHLQQRGKGYSPRIHKLVAHAFLGPCPEHMEVCHNDSDPSNNHLSNLRYDTHSHNMRDAVALGHMARPSALSDDQVIALRNARAGGASLKSLGAEFGLSPHYIGKTTTGRYYPDVGGPITNQRKLSFEDAQAIREQYQPGKVSYRDIAQQYHVDASTICRILKNERWIQQKD